VISSCFSLDTRPSRLVSVFLLEFTNATCSKFPRHHETVKLRYWHKDLYLAAFNRSYAYTYFAVNQLSPTLNRLSPLIASLLRTVQRSRVRPFRFCSLSACQQLDRLASGVTVTTWRNLFSLAFLYRVALAATVNLLTHYTEGKLSTTEVDQRQITKRFRLFQHVIQYCCTFPSQYFCTIDQHFLTATWVVPRQFRLESLPSLTALAANL